MSEINYTHITDFKKCEINPSDVCDGNWCEFDCTCDLPPHGEERMEISLVRVRVEGNPIRTRPDEAIYEVAIYKIHCKANEADYIYPDQDSFICSFSLTSAVDLKDLNRDHVSILKNYPVNEFGFQNTQKKINAPCPVMSYVNFFSSLVKNILTPVKPREQTANPHVAPKKKK